MAWKRVSDQDLVIEDFFNDSSLSVEGGIIFPHQERVEKAFEIALKMMDEGYNVYVCGPRGIGRTSYTLKRIEEIARQLPAPPDLCYINNFENPARPKCLVLPATYGKKLEEGIEEVLDYLKRETSKVFEGKEYEEELTKITKEIDKEKEKVFNHLTEAAKQHNLIVLFSPQGIKLLPLFKIQTPVSEEELFKDPRIQEEYQKNLAEFEPTFRSYLRKLRELDNALGESLIKLREHVAENLVNQAFQKLEETFKDFQEVKEYFKTLKKELTKNLHLFIEWEKAKGNVLVQSGINKSLNIFRVNLLVDNSSTQGAPVVYERVPTLKGLFGQINYRAEMGILYADHLSLTAGSLHKANGGFLVIDLWEVLKNPYLWIILKRALLHKKLYLMGGLIEEVPVPHVGLMPDPAPFSAKVFLIGDPYLYHLLTLYDEEFTELFKIKAEFDPVIPLDELTLKSFPKIVKKLIETENLKEITSSGLQELLKYALQSVGNRKKIWFNLEEFKNILKEANAYSQDTKITGEEIKKAIKEKIKRVNLIEEKIQEYIKEKKILLCVEGKRIGQINGLSVIALGDYSFGRPSRITAAVYPGSKGVINIEREIEMSGPIHTKGVLILSSYLYHKYSKDFQPQLSASLTFEQGYDLVEGDSASCAELIAILSAISDIPLRQDIAVTGSIDQFGNLQPVGGIKEKIEGFYKVCKLLKFTGTQGVIIPIQNFDNLILDEEILEDIKKGLFSIYTVENIDDLIELSTGLKSEKFHNKVYKRLKEFSKILDTSESKRKKKAKRKKLKTF